MNTLAMGALAVTGAVASWGPPGPPAQPQPDVNTATATASVYAAQATAATDAHDSSYVPGQSFCRFITIWLENTDYDKVSILIKPIVHSLPR